MIQTLIFDLGNVLLFFDHEKMYSQIAHAAALTPENVKKILFTEQWGVRFERGEANGRDLYKRFCDEAGSELDFSLLAHAVSDIFHPNEPLISLLETFKNRGRRLLLLSNTNEIHFTFAQKNFPFLQLFDRYILSYEVGALKPEKKIYEAAANAANCPLENCLFIDDLKINVEGALACGMPAHHFIDFQTLLLHLSQKQLV